MLTIINYERASNKHLLTFLKKADIDFKLSMEESEICNSDSIILPDFNDFKKTIKKLHLSNLSNLLRIIRKPVLGINNGMILFCDVICSNKYTGLGILNVDSLESEYLEEKRLKIINNNNSSLLYGIDSDTYFHFENEYFIELNEFTTTKSEINGISFSASIKRDNFYGVQFNPELSEENGLNVIQNFLDIVDKQ